MIEKLYVWLNIIIASSITISSGQTYCRIKRDRPNHHFGLWQNAFPYTQEQQPPSLCEGSVTVMPDDDGQVCINGRVTYKQIEESVGGRPIWTTTARTVSINGHLTAGSGTVVLGTKAKYLYDFVRSYTMSNGITYHVVDNDSRKRMLDNFLAASRGTIDGVCLDRTFVQQNYSDDEQESWYRITHHFFWRNRIIDAEKLWDENLGLIFFGRFNSVIEFHTPQKEKPGILKSTLGTLTMTMWELALTLDISETLFSAIPFVYATTGISRMLINGVFSTNEFPNPYYSPDDLKIEGEGVQVDCLWETLVLALQDGLFTTKKRETILPIYLNVVIKRVEIGNNFKNCWNGTMAAAIDVEAPLGYAKELDRYINNKLFPALTEFGEVGMSFGKRIPPNSDILRSGLDKYSSCGAELNFNPDNCYHPLCNRNNSIIANFEYPEQYYDL